MIVRNFRRAAPLLILLLSFLTLAGHAHADDRDLHGFQQRVFQSPEGGMLPYALFIPRNYDPKQKYPVVLFLHGAGERGMDNVRQIRDIAGWADPEVQAKYPCFIVAPQCPNWKEIFQVYGGNTELADTTYRNYKAPDKPGTDRPWKHYTISVGKHYIGKMNWLVFFNDDWGKDTDFDSLFRDVKVYEAGQSAKAKPVNFKGVTLTPYSGGGRGNNPIVEDSGETLHLAGDTRKKMAFPYTVTKNTVLEFDFKSNKQGSIHGIGLDDDDQIFENRWVQVDWGARSHVIPKDPSPSLKRVMELLPTLEKEFPTIDSRRRYITGLSMGGYGTWDLIARRPDWFAAAVPICGGGDMETANSIAKIPTWDFHGHDDGTVSPSRSRNMIAALWNVGSTPKYTEYPQTGHNSWLKAYKEPELLPWLFAQKRVTTPPPAPTDLKAVAIKTNRVDLAWNEAVDKESGIKEYHVYRDGGEIGITVKTAYTDTEVGENEVHSYTVLAQNNAWLNSPQTPQAWAKIGEDKFPPAVLTARAQGSLYTVEVAFDKPVNAKQAENVDNYSLDNGATVNRAYIEPDQKTVLLSTSALMPKQSYTLTVSGITDRATKPNTIASNTHVPFTYDPCLVAHWRFDEGQGTRTIDVSGNENVLNLRGADWTQGRWGKGLLLDGTPEHVAQTRQSQTLDLTDGLTISCWVKKSAGYYEPQILLAKHQFYDHRAQFLLDFDPSQQVRAMVGTMDKGEITVLGHRLDARDWHHIVMTYGNDTLELYIDGVLQGSAHGAGKLLSVSEPIIVGGGHQGRDPFKGVIDEVRIYNRALLPEEVKALTDAPSG